MIRRHEIPGKTIMVLFIFILIIPFLFHAGSEAATVTGKVVGNDGKVVKAGIVAFFKKNNAIQYEPRKYRFEPVEVAFIESDGVFKERLDSGIYYVEVIQRASNMIIGPPGEGENHCVSLDDKGMPREYIIKDGEMNDIGKISGFKPYIKLKVDDISTGITGVVLSRNGSPVSGAVVFAYAHPSMKGNALFVSDKTGIDGSYVVGFYGGGTYYISAENMDDDSVDETRVTERVPVKLDKGQIIGGIEINN